MVTVSYFSAGVSSAVATKLMIGEIDRIMYTHIDDHHPDTRRFVGDCEIWFGKPVEIMQSQYKTVDAAIRSGSFLKNRSGGAACTRLLKRTVRKQFEYENEGQLRIVWGLDYDERHRAERVVENMPNHDHVFPLIDRRMTKEMAHEVLAASGIRRPAMYELGYHNNNCIGCIKGGMGYWNKIRRDFPDVYEQRGELERHIGFPIIGKGIWLDEMDAERGRHDPPILGDCGILCEVMSL